MGSKKLSLDTWVGAKVLKMGKCESGYGILYDAINVYALFA